MATIDQLDQLDALHSARMKLLRTEHHAAITARFASERAALVDKDIWWIDVVRSEQEARERAAHAAADATADALAERLAGQFEAARRHALAVDRV